VTTSLDSFKSRRTLKVGSKSYVYYSLTAAEKNGLKGASKLPYSMKVLLENLLRHEDGNSVTAEDAAFSLQRVVKLNKTPGYLLTQFGWAPGNVDKLIRASDASTLVLTLPALQASGILLSCRQAQIRHRGCRLRLIIDQSVLFRSVGAVGMVEQFSDLLAVGAGSAVTLQVAELSRPLSVLSPSFTLLNFADATDSGAVGRIGFEGQVVTSTRRADVRGRRQALAELVRVAASAEQSRHLIESAAKHWKRQVGHER